MRFKIPKVDLRDRWSGSMPIIDEETGRHVGQFKYRHRSGRTVSLFDGKFVGVFEKHEECVAFAKGVAAVLSYREADQCDYIPMSSTNAKRSTSSD
jgi:hypothetical protein